MKKALRVLAIIATVMVTVLPLAACGNSSTGKSEDDLKDIIAELIDKNEELTNKVDDLIDKNEELTNKVDDLIEENGELTDKINALNVFTSDKAEYGERETMTVYFKNTPVLRIRIDFDGLGTALCDGRTMNHSLCITSLCADIYASTIVDTSYAVSNVGTFVRISSAETRLLKQGVEKAVFGRFTCSKEEYDNSTWFDIVICVPGTPFELARFKNVSHS